jgi:hypothetical protein
MDKNSKQLKSFIEFCKKHPEQRFWQALRNWAKADYVLISNMFDVDMFDDKWLAEHPDFDIYDTFHETGKNDFQD